MIFSSIYLIAEDYVDLNLFIEPRFKKNNMNMVNFLIKNIKNDSISQKLIFAGRLLEEPQSDSATVAFINLLEPDIVSPVDYLFNEKSLDQHLLISNIKSDSLQIIENKIIEADSFKIGIFSIYTPDFAVKNSLAEHVIFNSNIFEIARYQAELLSQETDFVIMLSSLSKYIDADIVKNIPVDAIVSFDYQEKRNELLNNKTKFYSIISNKNKYGKLRFTFDNGKLNCNWIEERLK